MSMPESCVPCKNDLVEMLKKNLPMIGGVVLVVLLGLWMWKKNKSKKQSDAQQVVDMSAPVV